MNGNYASKMELFTAELSNYVHSCFTLFLCLKQLSPQPDL